MLSEGKEIINIDESSISTTNYSRKSWSLKGIHSVSTDAIRLGNYNVIAAISSIGRSAFVVGNGSNNQLTFMYFLLGMCSLLAKEHPDWRNRVVFLLDNATYHKGKDCIELFQRLKLPVFFQGPYSFRTAPVEMVFSQIKKKQLVSAEAMAATGGSKKEILRQLGAAISDIQMGNFKAYYGKALSGIEKNLKQEDV